MRFIKIALRGGKEFSFPDYKVNAVLNSQEQLVRVTNKKGEWTGTTINKADIQYTEYDPFATREWKLEHEKTNALPEGGELEQEEIRKKIKEVGKKLKV
jgi:hypothetical protein